MKFKLQIVIMALAIVLGSCSTGKNIPYMIDAESIPKEVLQQSAQSTDPIAMPGDILEIIVTDINLDAVKPFNRADYVNQISGVNTANQTNPNNASYYLVDSNGDIDFPILGKLRIGGMNKSAIQSLISSKIYPKYLTEQPGVDVRFRNFKVSVLGEVKTPGVFTSPNERLTVLEAIAMAGDLNITGQRENVMLIRTNADGSKLVQRLNLNDKNLLLSPYYNLQQNDVIYVVPNASKARSSWSVPPALALTLSSVGTLISIATLIVTITK